MLKGISDGESQLASSPARQLAKVSCQPKTLITVVPTRGEDYQMIQCFVNKAEADVY
jgi:hypothetical protein